MKEEYLLTGVLEPTNEPYAIAKIAGMKMCECFNRQWDTDFRSVMPTNLYGPGDNFDLNSSHVLPAMIRKFHDADDVVTLWGTGSPRREFLHSDDAAAAILHLVEHYDGAEHVNVGTGEDISIRDLAALVAEVVGYTGDIEWDVTKPDGTPRKVLDVSVLADLGWRSSIPLNRGVRSTYDWFLAQR